MGKIVGMLVALVLVLTLGSCSTPTRRTEEAMIMKQSEFSEETRSVLEFVDEDLFFFDFIVNDTIKSYTVGAWIYDGGAWKDYGGTSGNIDTPNNRMAIKVTETGYKIKTANDSGFIGYSAEVPYDEFDHTTQQGSYQLTDPTTIAAGTEITLWCKIGNSGNGLSINHDFRNADCTAGMAFTITFSDEALQ